MTLAAGEPIGAPKGRHERVLRRRFWSLATLAVIGGLSVALVACGGDDDSGTTTSGETTTTPDEPAVSLTDVAAASGTINVAGWQFYENEEVQDAGTVQSDWSYVGADQNILNKARSGNFDVTTNSGATVAPLVALDVLAPIDTSLLSNYEQIPAELRDDPLWKNAEGQVIAVPYALSPGFTAYNTDEVSEPQSLDDLLGPEFAGGIGLFDDPGMISNIATAQGVEDTTQMTQAELDGVLAYLEELRPNIKAFFEEGEDAQLFNRGDIVATIGSFGFIITEAQEVNPAIEFNLLAEETFVDSWSILKGGDELAGLNWIDATLSNTGQDAIVDVSAAYPSNPAAVPALAALGDTVSVALSELTVPELLEMAPPVTGFAVEAEGDVVTVDEATRAWNDFKGSF